ncbi:MAG: DsbA family protein [Ktedonobacterales bacterium]
MAELTIPVSDRDHVRGVETAPATLVIYGDYECPYTRLAYRAVQRVLADEPEYLRFVFRHFPLSRIHPHAQQASEAAEAAAAQGTFWEMHDMLFAHQHALEDTDLARYAQELGLDVERFARELGANAYAGRIQEDHTQWARQRRAGDAYALLQRPVACWRLRRCGATGDHRPDSARCLKSILGRASRTLRQESWHHLESA